VASSVLFIYIRDAVSVGQLYFNEHDGLNRESQVQLYIIKERK
jgi:hypothetical protein